MSVSTFLGVCGNGVHVLKAEGLGAVQPVPLRALAAIGLSFFFFRNREFVTAWLHVYYD